MNAVSNAFARFFDSLVNSNSGFDETTWGVIAVTTVLFGYFLLRGNSVR